MIMWFRYVRHADVPRFIAAGWEHAADLGVPHGEWSVLMRWAGEGEPDGPA